MICNRRHIWTYVEDYESSRTQISGHLAFLRWALYSLHLDHPVPPTQILQTPEPPVSADAIDNLTDGHLLIRTDFHQEHPAGPEQPLYIPNQAPEGVEAVTAAVESRTWFVSGDLGRQAIDPIGFDVRRVRQDQVHLRLLTDSRHPVTAKEGYPLTQPVSAGIVPGSQNGGR